MKLLIVLICCRGVAIPLAGAAGVRENASGNASEHHGARRGTGGWRSDGRTLSAARRRSRCLLFAPESEEGREFQKQQLYFRFELEDERIEDLFARESPGYAPYLLAAKDALLDRGDFGRKLGGWDRLCDLDRVNAIICAFIRCPHLLTEAFEPLRTAAGNAPSASW